MTLLGRVVFHLEGTETTARRNVSGEPVCLVRTFGFHRWIEEAADGHMTALDLLALVLYRRYFRADDARAVVHGWHEELRRAVEAGEVTPRDPSSLLPCRADFEGLGWLVSRADAARLLERHQTGIDLDATIAEMLEGARYEGEAHHHPETGEWMESRWPAGHEPQDCSRPAAIEPVEWCEMLAEGWFMPEAQTPAEPTPAPSASAPDVVEPVEPPADAVMPVNGLPMSQWKVPRSNRWTKAAKDQMRAMRDKYTDLQIAETFNLNSARQVGNLIGSRSANKAAGKDHRKIIDGCIESSAVIGSASGHRIT